MRKIICASLCLSILASWVSATVIISDTIPKVFDMGDGDVMLVIGDDIASDDLETLAAFSHTSELSKNSGTIQKSTQSSYSQPNYNNVQAQNGQTSSTAPIPNTATRIASEPSFNSQAQKKFNYVNFFSSFGGLGQRSDQTEYRKLVHNKNMNWLNSEKKKPRSFSMDENQFSMLTLDEFKSLYLNLQVPDKVPSFEFDVNKELQKFIKADEQFIDKFFGMDLHTDSSSLLKDYGLDSDPFNSFESHFSQKQQIQPSSEKQELTPSSVQPQNNQETITPSSDSEVTPEYQQDIQPAAEPEKDVEPEQFTASDQSVTPSESDASSAKSEASTISDATSIAEDIIPASIILDVDWVTKGFVSSIKDQGSCGGCYSFTAQANIESILLMSNVTQYKDIDLSQQQIIDCSAKQGNQGCNGGWMPNVFDYVIQYGTTGQASYPYTASKSNCKVSGGSYSIKSYKGGALSNCTMLSAMIVSRPVSIAVAAGNQYWQYYSGGILTQCGRGGIDHGVMLVGVYQDHTENYWKIKNSWGTTWGESGYMRIDRNTDNLCRICSYGYYPEI